MFKVLEKMLVKCVRNIYIWYYIEEQVKLVWWSSWTLYHCFQYIIHYSMSFIIQCDLSLFILIQNTLFHKCSWYFSIPRSTLSKFSWNTVNWKTLHYMFGLICVQRVYGGVSSAAYDHCYSTLLQIKQTCLNFQHIRFINNPKCASALNATQL